MPLVNKTFSDIITFSRGSNATMFDSSGTLVYAPNNLLTYSEEFDDAAWTKGALNTTGTPPWVNVAVAPDGNTTADKLIEDSSNAQHHVRQSSITVPFGATVTVSVFAKAAERTTMQLYMNDSSTTANRVQANFDLSAGTTSAASNFGTFTGATSSVTDVGNGWYRCVLTGVATGVTSVAERIAIGTTSYTGDGTSGIYIWGAQLNIDNMQGGVTGSLSTYYPTTSAAYYGPRLDYDPATLAARGLLIEEQRTNLLLQSEDFSTTWTASASPTITTNTTVAPDGTTTADTIAATSTSSYVAQIITFTGDGTKTYSLFIKAGTSSTNRIFIRDTTASASRGQADITWTGGVPSAVVTNGSLQSLQACPNGWYRLAVIVDSVVAANTNQIRIQPDNVSGTNDVILWGAQAENGAFSTSYIPTTTTALTRSADVASVNTLSPWFNATEGTLFVEASPQVSNNQAYVIAGINDATASNRITLSKLLTTGNASFSVLVSGATQASTNSGAWTDTGKLVGAYKLNDFASSLNGSAAATDTSGTIPTVTQMTLGRRGDGGNSLNGHLRRITYYPRRLSNAELVSVTS